MLPKRSRSSSSGDPIYKRRKDYSPTSSRASSPVSVVNDSDETIQLFIVQAKMSPQAISDLFTLLEMHKRQLKRAREATSSISPPLFELCQDVNEADILVTDIRMRKRLERHVPWDVAKQKAIVTSQWLRDSIAKQQPLPHGDYAALQEFHDETAGHSPDSSYQKGKAPLPPGIPPPLVDEAISFKLSYTSRYACLRASPLICPNQGLATMLDVLRRSRELEGLNINALSYERAVAAIKAYPHTIETKDLEDLDGLPGIGDKTMAKIKEYLKTGEIKESQETLNSSRYQSLSQFTTVYGIGPTTARQLYDRGLRTLDHLKTFYEADDIDAITIATKPSSGRLPKPAPDITIKVGLALQNDLTKTIPRAEVEEMHRVVMRELECLQPGCTSTIVGGYRRGKPESNDVDIIFSHPDLKHGGDKVKGLCTKLVKLLYDKGLVTHVMHLSSFRQHNALKTGHWDSLEKALTVFILPPDGKIKQVHRRLDLIFAAPEVYWTAVVGWTGSKMFERDLRFWAKEKMGMKFDSSGITRRHDSKLYNPKSEEDVFKFLGLPWVDPTFRNANV